MCVLRRCTARSGLSVCGGEGWGKRESDLGGAGAKRDVGRSACERK